MNEEFTVDIPVRYRDLDPLGHVNNAVYVSYLETARVDYLEAVADIAAEDISFVIANLEIDYERPITKGDDPTVALWIAELGETSCTMDYEIRADGTVAATAETTMVHVDPDTGRATPLPDELRARMQPSENVGPSA
ncbi:acyl-CoA thioesterase [Haloarchaeobius amylolyticus]|uniref:Acyl-CoA thioesterase n=1 Tax=Haloarchaeobius amylolyticus TaxID=1198296 RepID=A0ABD6BFT1_9EURY